MSAANVVVCGYTGVGKSTLCNTITHTNLFKEGESSVSVTRVAQCEEVAVDGLAMKIVDTVGFTDTTISDTTILQSISSACTQMLGGVVHQLFFVIKDRITEQQVDKLVELQDAVFGPNIRGYTTIVRTQFPSFKNADAVQADKNLIQQYPRVAKIFSLAQKILYVDNPPLSLDDEEISEIAQNLRQHSSTILLTHIKMCSLATPYVGPFNNNPISLRDKEEQLRLEQERKARELEAARKQKEEEERRKKEEMEQKRRQLEQQQRIQQQEIERLRREAEIARKKHEEELQRIRGNSRDTAGQHKEYVICSTSNGRYFKLKGRGRFDVSNSMLTINGGPWELAQQSSPFPGGIDAVVAHVEDMTCNCDMRITGGLNIRNLNVGGNLTLG